MIHLNSHNKCTAISSYICFKAHFYCVAFWNKTCRIFDVKGIICCWVWWITQRCPLFSKMQRLTILYYRKPWLEVFIQELKLNSNSHFILQNIQTDLILIYIPSNAIALNLKDVHIIQSLVTKVHFFKTSIPVHKNNKIHL